MSAVARTDVHRPSAINPEDYDFVACEYMRLDDLGSCHALMEARRTIQAHMARTGGTYSGHQHGGNCHVCGASAIYTCLFHHRPTNSYIRTGFDCADKLDGGHAERFRKAIATALEARAGKRKAYAVLAQAGLQNAWAVYQAGESEGFERTLNPCDPPKVHREESIIRDMVGRLIQYGSISEKQIAFARKLVDAITRRPEIEAQRAAETAAAAPVPVIDKRTTVRGEVLTIRLPDRHDDDQFARTKILVRSAEGFKLWGNMPAGLSDATKGDTVEFDARIKPSEKDPKFGFFSRPTKARIVADLSKAS